MLSPAPSGRCSSSLGVLLSCSARQADDDRFGLKVQEGMVKDYAKKNNLELGKTYTDTITGKASTREGLNNLLGDAHYYDAVLISSIDRLARRVPVAYTALASLMEAGLDVHSTDTGLIDLDDETSAMNFGIKSIFSHTDHLKITKRMYEGKIARAKSGKLVRPIAAYGYRNNEPYEPEAQWVRWIFKEIHNQGMYAVARELNRLGVPVKGGGKMWYNSTICVILNNPAYKGMWRFGRKKETIHVPCTPIVNEDDWERAQKAKAAWHKNHPRAGSRLDIFPLQGRIFCAVCGSAMSGQTWKARPDLRYYFCRATQRLSALTAKCDHKISYPADKINDEVRKWLYKTFATEESLRASLTQPEEPEMDFSAIREEKEAEYNRWMKAYGSGKFDLDKVAEQLERLEKELAAIPKTEPPKKTATRFCRMAC